MKGKVQLSELLPKYGSRREADVLEKKFIGLIALTGILMFTGKAVSAEVQAKEMRDFFPYGVHIGFSAQPEGQVCQNEQELKDSIERVCKDLTEHNMNCAMVANCRIEDINLWLEVAEKYGIRLFFQGGGFPMFIRPPETGGAWVEQLNPYQRKEEVFAFWKKMAEKYRDSKTLLAWSLTEENPANEKWAKFLAEIVAMMAKIDPNHPAFVIDNMAPAGELNAKILKTRIVCTDRYPFFTPHIWWMGTQAEARSYLEKEFTRFYSAAQAEDAVLWVVGQGARYGLVKIVSR